jgi:hypothetical protein
VLCQDAYQILGLLNRLIESQHQEIRCLLFLL